MADLLTAADLEFMRATQAEARPTRATLRHRTTVRTATGGTTVGYGEPDLIDVRIHAAADEVPIALASRFGTATPHKIVMDLVRDVRDGDRVEVSPTEAYEVVTDGDPDAWATAQIVYARRVAHPVRG